MLDFVHLNKFDIVPEKSILQSAKIIVIILFVQLPVKVEHFSAAIDNVSNLLTVVMGLETALMAVMKLDVVS